MNVGEYVKEYRKENSISRAEFAEVIGISGLKLAQIENGQTEPDTALFYEISEVTNTPMWILTDSEALEKRGAIKRRATHIVGINALFMSVNNIASFCCFLDTINVACDLLAPETGLTALVSWKGFSSVDIGSELDFLDDVVPAYIDFDLEKCEVAIKTPVQNIKITKESAKSIKPSYCYFPNEGYGVEICQNNEEFEVLIGIAYK